MVLAKLHHAQVVAKKKRTYQNYLDLFLPFTCQRKYMGVSEYQIH
jgi:hypothetical protein